MQVRVLSAVPFKQGEVMKEVMSKEVISMFCIGRARTDTLEESRKYFKERFEKFILPKGNYHAKRKSSKKTRSL
jgi:hypothetical protein